MLVFATCVKVKMVGVRVLMKRPEKIRGGGRTYIFMYVCLKFSSKDFCQFSVCFDYESLIIYIFYLFIPF
jgi:hypothetical protein